MANTFGSPWRRRKPRVASLPVVGALAAACGNNDDSGAGSPTGASSSDRASCAATVELEVVVCDTNQAEAPETTLHQEFVEREYASVRARVHADTPVRIGPPTEVWAGWQALRRFDTSGRRLDVKSTAAQRIAIGEMG